jgi:hypothetical protein
MLPYGSSVRLFPPLENTETKVPAIFEQIYRDCKGQSLDGKDDPANRNRRADPEERRCAIGLKHYPQASQEKQAKGPHFTSVHWTI